MIARRRDLSSIGGSNIPGTSFICEFDQCADDVTGQGGLPVVGDRLANGRFEIVRQLGRGGMGVVFEVFDRVRAQSVAMKMLLHVDGSGIYHLKREFRALSDVTHNNIARLHELHCDDRCWYFTMELVRGQPFDRWIRPNDAFDELRLRTAAAQLATAVYRIHEAGKLHRDLGARLALLERCLA